MNTELIKQYEKKNWEFRREDWQNGHNGDWEESFYAKSPRLEEGFSFHSERGTEKDLLDSEARAYARQLWEEKSDDIEEAFIKKTAKEKRLKPLSAKKNCG